MADEPIDMRPSAILWGLSLVLVLVLVLLWRIPGAPSVPDAARPGVGEDRARLEGGATASGEGARPVSPPSATRRDALTPAAAREPTCRIRVVEAASKAPVPDARVWIQRADVEVDSTEWWTAMRRSNDVEPVLRSGLGDELALDERAEAFLPRPRRARVVVAARDELHGEAMLEPGEDECVVELVPYHSLEIEVVDRSDHPVPGALVVLYAGEFDPLDDWSIWVAGADGRVRLPKLEGQFWAQGYRGPVRVSLAAAVVGEPEVAQFTLETVPSDPVRFVAGDFGRVVLQLVDAKGAELALDGQAHLELEEERLDDPSLAIRAGTDIDGQLTSGRAVFATVGLGLTLDVMLAAEGHAGVWRVLPGPTEAGEELRVLVPVGERLARARGRVHGVRECFGDRGSVRALLTARSADGRGYLWSHVGEGESFDRPIPHVTGVGGLGEHWILELSYRTTSVRATTVPRLDESVAAVDFGDVRFAPLPELARVRVCDDSGAPVPHARVDIDSPAGDDSRWCDAAGSCLVTGALAELPMQLSATRQDWLPGGRVRIDAPGSEATLTLRRGGVVLGRLRFPRGARGDDFEIRLRVEPSTPGVEAQVLVAEPLEDGRFRLAPCESGRATLTVYYEGPAVLERTGIELAPGRTLELEPLELDGVLHPFALAFELSSGEPWNGGHLEVREPDGELSTWRTIGSSARASFLALRSSVDLWVAARGAQATFFENVRDGDLLALPPAPSVRLRLAAGMRPPDPPLVLLVRATPESEVEFETYDDVDVQEALVGEDGSAWLRVPWPGAYELAWFVRHGGTGVEHAVEQAQVQRIAVTETSAVPEVEARITRAEVELAILRAGW